MRKYVVISFLLFFQLIFSNELIKAIEKDDLVAVRLMETQKKDFNIYDNILGKNILSYAIFVDAQKVAKYLIENKKYRYMINQKSNDGTYAIYDAVLKENEGILLLLLENGAIVKKGVYDLATRHGKGRMVKILRDFELKKNSLWNHLITY